jgi:hypothetical protein
MLLTGVLAAILFGCGSADTAATSAGPNWQNEAKTNPNLGPDGEK